MEQLIQDYSVDMTRYESLTKRLADNLLELRNAERELLHEESRLINEGLIDGRNEQARKAQLISMTQDHQTTVDQKKLNHEILQIEIESLRQRLRMYNAILVSSSK